MSLSQLFGSGTAAHVVCGGVAKICTVRFLLCRDLLILQQLLLRLRDPVSTAPGAVPCSWDLGTLLVQGGALSLPTRLLGIARGLGRSCSLLQPFLSS